MKEKYNKAIQIFNDGMKLYQAGTVESLQAAIPKFEQAQRFFQEVNAQQEVAGCVSYG